MLNCPLLKLGNLPISFYGNPEMESAPPTVVTFLIGLTGDYDSHKGYHETESCHRPSLQKRWVGDEEMKKTVSRCASESEREVH